MSRAAILLAALLLAAVAIPSDARAHGIRPGVLALEEIAPGTYEVGWTEPEDSRIAVPSVVAITYPEGCVRESSILRCEGGLAGTMRFDDVPDPRTRIVVSITALDGSVREAVASGEQPEIDLDAAPGSSFVAWLGLGVEHVLGGIDHLAFVLGLLLVCGIDRRLVITVTAFTLAHSLTLALAAFDVVTLPSAPVEATIAASVMLVAREATHDQPTLTRRMPWLVAAIFGLVHGLGFAGALAEIGLPRGSEALALVGFNVGVELGQLAVVAVAVLIARAVGSRAPQWSRPALALAIGSLGALWLIERTVAIVS